MSTQHPFERTLGPGPYRFVGYVRIVISETRGAAIIGDTHLTEGPNGANCGTCNHCGMGIMHNYILRNGEGKHFAVGCDCVGKSSLPYEIKSAVECARLNMERKKRREKKEAARARLLAQRKKEYEEFRPLWDASVRVKAAWKRQPHPDERLAQNGMTLADYIEWNLSRSNMNALRPYFAYLEMEANGEFPVQG